MASHGIEVRPLRQMTGGATFNEVFFADVRVPDDHRLGDGTLDAVINQQPQNLIMNSVRIFTNLRERKNPLVGVEPVRISLVLRENLP